MNGMLLASSAASLFAIPSEVISSYVVGGIVFAIGLIVIVVSGDWHNARGSDKLLLFGPLFYMAPLAAFGTEHFTIARTVASLVPKWIPWHMFWTYFVGACFIAAAFAVVVRIQPRLAAGLVALTFFFFVVLMDAPGWARHPRDRFAVAYVLRELSFSGGALALAASLSEKRSDRGAHIAATIARYFIAVPVLFYSLEQFLHPDHVPGVPLEMVTPGYVYGHAIWTYVAAVVYAVAGTLLLLGKKTRSAATWLGETVLLLVIVVYLPIAIVEHSSLDGLNYAGDTLMYCGAVLLLARVMRRQADLRQPTAVSQVPMTISTSSR